MTDVGPVVAIIPARGGSRGIPRKNLQVVGGKPLVVHAIDASRESPLIDRVIVNSEDEEIRAVAAAHGAETQARPEDFWHDDTFQEVDRLLCWAVQDLEMQGGMRFGTIVLVYPTAPLRRAEHVTETVRRVVERGYDSALTLVKSHAYLWRAASDGTVEPTNYDPAKRGPHQKEGWNQWIENKAVYAMRRDLLLETGCRLGGRIGYVEMSDLDSIDVDYPEDLQMVELVFSTRGSR